MQNTSKYENKVYKLYGAIEHSGGLYGGHYTATCLNRQNNKWINYSDSNCYQNWKQPDFSNAYALFY